MPGSECSLQSLGNEEGRPTLPAARRVLLLGAAVLWGSAFYLLGEVLAAPLGFLAAAILVFLARSGRIPLAAVLGAFFVAHWGGFAWFIPALRVYTEWPIALCAIIFSLFALYGALQFVVLIWGVRSETLTSIRRLSLDIPLVWFSLELLFLRPFDWSFSHTLVGLPMLIQAADIGGGPLVSAMWFWCVSLVVDGLIQRRDLLWRSTLAATICGSFLLYGAFRMRGDYSDGRTLNVMAVNLATPPLRSFDSGASREVLRRYVAASKVPPSRSADLVVWPESAILEPIVDLTPNELLKELQSVGMPLSQSLVAGVQRSDGSAGYLNSAALITSEGRVAGFYDKVVPFPLAEGDLAALFGFGRLQLQSALNFSLELPDGAVEVTPLICFESTLDRFVNLRMQRAHSHLLLELSNLNWFAGTIAPRQHEVLAMLRAVEQRLPLLRVVNGVGSTLIGPNGRVRYSDQATDPQTLAVPLGRGAPTIFRRYGETLHVIALMFAGLLVGVRLWRWSAQKRWLKSNFDSIPPLRLMRAILLLALGCLPAVGVVAHQPLLTAAGMTIGAAPNPFVFNEFEGINYWAHDAELELLGRDLQRQKVKIDAKLFARLPGPHLYHMAIAVPFAFAPVYPREYWVSALQWGFCSADQSEAPLRSLVGASGPIASVKLSIKERIAADGKRSRDWEYRIVCGEANDD